ncbi:PIN domain-containing protein [candidate division KSB1 bacterium]|nr:PIN domain-containing protein [candidate division KSB1 bacterium]
MKDKYFVDTNVIVYANDGSDKNKQQKAKQLILDGIRKGIIVVSAQVLSEFYIVSTQKLKIKLSPEIAKKEIQLLSDIEIIEIDYNLILNAIDIANEYKLSYWDALIVAAALKSKANILYSEDLNHGQMIKAMQIINPFLTSSASK